jgi:hypothetical protein
MLLNAATNDGRSAAIAAILREDTPRPNAADAFAIAICGRRFEAPPSRCKAIK